MKSSETSRVRPADPYVSSGHRQPGVVLVGDGFETTCPRERGTGIDKVVTDVERLCNVFPHGPSARRRTSRSVLAVIVVAAGLIGRIMRLMALIVPEPSIHSVGGEQLGMRTAFDRLAA